MGRKIALLMTYCLIMPMIIAALPKANADTTFVKLMSDTTELGPEDAVGKTFEINCTIENVELLYGVDIQITWPTEYIEYVDHNKTIPRGTQWPNGILYSPTIPVKDDVDETASMPGAAPETRYWLAEASMAPAEKFNGTGTAFEMVFRIKKHPMITDTYIHINITSSTLANFYGDPIDHVRINCTILLHGKLQPPGPQIKINSINYKGTVPYFADINVSILNLDQYWDLGGFDLKIKYNPKLMQAIDIKIDPDEWFTNCWPNGILVVKNETDNLLGRVWVAVIGIPGDGGDHTPPSGNATLFTITFEFSASGPIEKILDTFSLAGFPHPEREEPPYNNSESSVPIPFTVINGFADVVGIQQHTPLPGYTVITESSSSVSQILFTEGIPLLLFNVTGAEGYIGYCNVTIPKDFMWSTDGWVVLINGIQVTPMVTEDEQNTYIYIEYSGGSHNIAIIGSDVVPEFNLLWTLIILLGAIIITVLTKMLKARKISSPFFCRIKQKIITSVIATNCCHPFLENH